MGGKPFNAKRAPVGHLTARVQNTGRFVVTRMANGNIARVNSGMVKTAARQNNIPVNTLAEHLRKLGANI